MRDKNEFEVIPRYCIAHPVLRIKIHVIRRISACLFNECNEPVSWLPRLILGSIEYFIFCLLLAQLFRIRRIIIRLGKPRAIPTSQMASS